MKITIIILNFNHYEETLSCLDSVSKLHKNNFDTDVIVVDNASRNDSNKLLHEKFPQINILVNPENFGFAEGNNVGIRYALKRNADFLLIINNDTILDQNAVNELYNGALNNKQGGIFGPKIYFAKGYETHKFRYKPGDLGNVIWYAGGIIDWNNVLAAHRGVDEVDKGNYEEITRTDFISGCAMFIRREVLETVGIFDSKYYLYYEDVDLCERALRKGFEIFFVPQAKIWHKNAGTAGGTGSDLQSYYITRNRMLIGMRYATWRTKLALYRESLRLLIKGTKTQKQAIADFYQKKYGKRG